MTVSTGVDGDAVTGLATYGAALAVFAAALAAVMVLRWAGTAITEVPLEEHAQVPFTGGEPPRFHAWNRYHVRYYVMTLMFLAFDLEMVYMYPWAVVFAREGLVAFVEMGMFAAILMLGVVYAWRERGLTWA